MSVNAEAGLNGPLVGEGRRIVVVRRPNDPFDRNPYMIHLLLEQWRGWGFTVDVSDHMDTAAGPRTVVLPHLDATRTPSGYQTSFSRCAVVLNRMVIDISKRRISENLIARPTAYDGPVIVKTDSNSGGEPEFERLNGQGRIAHAALALARRLPWALTGMIGKYKVFDHARLVPRAVWSNPFLVVEKFLPERQEGLYCLRQYTFLGTAEINTLAFSDDPMIKAQNFIRCQVLPEPQAFAKSVRRSVSTMESLTTCCGTAASCFSTRTAHLHTTRPVRLDLRSRRSLVSRPAFVTSLVRQCPCPCDPR
jgi:hypothetical protein